MDQVLYLVDRAVADGVDVGIDAYPYLAGSAYLTQGLPTWALEGGIEELMARLKRGDARNRIATETEAGMSNTWSDVVVCGVSDPADQALVGLKIQEIAE